SVLSFLLAVLVYLFPSIGIGENVLLAGVSILVIALVIWRRLYEWIIGLSAFCERVYVLGSGERARSIVEILRSRRDVGMEVLTEQGCGVPGERLLHFTEVIRASRKPNPPIDRVVVAMEDRRGLMPLRELLALRLSGVVIEDASLLIERLTGKVLLEGLTPS